MHEYEEITEALREVEPEIAEIAHPDSFMVVRKTRVPDGFGGHKHIDAVVDQGRCRLSRGGGGSETNIGPVVISVSGYVATLPRVVDLRPSDRLMVNAREFEVIEVIQAGEHSLFTKARLEELRT